LAVNHPELVRTLILAEPPLLPWLNDLGEQGKEFLRKQNEDFVSRSRAAIGKGDVERAIEIFVDYVIHKGAYKGLSSEARASLLRNKREFIAEVQSPSMFAPLTREEVGRIKVPTLMLSGANTIGGLRLTDAELERALPEDRCRRVVIPEATHAMWYEQPKACMKAVSDFITTADKENLAQE
jgi:pimeloyl-ACP methyl ester carboxylesterase